MTSPAPEYVAARRTLLDALDALGAHRASMILIGAQAVYLHTGSSEISEPPMTTDADLALDADLLADDPEIAGTMIAAGFEPKQPGHWENPQGIAIDLMVALHQSNRTSASARAADLHPHARTVARIASGLAPALVDNSRMVVPALDPSDPRTHPIRVAGPAALLIAKIIKISDRIADARRGQMARVIDKDALDILRLLQAVSITELEQGLTRHALGSPASEDIARGLQFLREQGTSAGRLLPRLAERASREDPTVAVSFVVLTQELLASIP
jgi:hypothetical protein